MPLYQEVSKKYDSLTLKLTASSISQLWTRSIIFLIFCGFAFQKTEKISKKIVNNFFTGYPASLLNPVTAPRLLIDPSQWAPPLVKPEGSHTERIYQKLFHFVLEGAEDCSKGHFYPVSDVGKQHKFTWAIFPAAQVKENEPSDSLIEVVKIGALNLSKLLKQTKRRGLVYSAWFREHFPLTARNVNEFGDP